MSYWGAIISAATSLYNGSQAAHGADAQGDAAQRGLDFTQQVYHDSQGNFAPYLAQGQTGVNGLNRLANGDYSGFINSPDYKFRVQQANDSFDNSAAARGRLFSGGAIADRDALNQGLASQGLNDYRQSLQYLATGGQNAAGTLGGIGSGTSQMVNGQYNQIGNANADRYGAYAGALTGVAGAANNWLQGQQNQNQSSYSSGQGDPLQSYYGGDGYSGGSGYQSGGSGTFWGYP